MKLPVYLVNDDSANNVAENGLELPVYGDIYPEYTNETLISKFPDLKVDAKMFWAVPDDLEGRDWTFECHVKDLTAVNNVLLASSDSQEYEFTRSGWRLQTSAEGIMLLTRPGTFLTIRKFIKWPDNLPRELHIAATSTKGLLRVYVNYELVIEYDISNETKSHKVCLLGTFKPDGSPYEFGFEGILRFVSFTPGVVLPPELFQRIDGIYGKDVVNSQVMDVARRPSDLTTAMISQLSSSIDYVIVRLNNGETHAFDRPQGFGEGVSISDVSYDGSEVVFTDSNGQTYTIDVTYPEGEGSDLPSGTGILTEEAGIPVHKPLQLNTARISETVADGVRLLSLTDRPDIPLAEETAITMTIYNQSSNPFADSYNFGKGRYEYVLNYIAYGKYVMPDRKQFGTQNDQTEGMLVMPGKYFVTGWITVIQMQGGVEFQLIDRDLNVLFSQPYAQVAINSLYNQSTVRIPIVTELVITKPTEILPTTLIKGGSAGGINCHSTDTKIRIGKIELYKV